MRRGDANAIRPGRLGVGSERDASAQLLSLPLLLVVVVVVVAVPQNFQRQFAASDTLGSVSRQCWGAANR